MSDSMLRAVTSQVDWWWKGVFRPRVAGLTDDEFWWKPVTDCWTLQPLGDGTVIYEHSWPPPTPTPLTTIAWRLLHIAVGCLQARTVRYFPDAAGTHDEPVMYGGPVIFPATATEALAFLDEWWAKWRAGLAAAGDRGLAELIGDREHDSADMALGRTDPVVNVVLHNHRELMHHGGEICLLRDLFAGQQPQDPFVLACLVCDLAELDAMLAADPDLADRTRAARPDLVRRAVERGHAAIVVRLVGAGFPLDVPGPSTVLHHAAAGGNRTMAELLVGLGADVHAIDEQWKMTPLGWAEHFEQQSVADYLRPLM